VYAILFDFESFEEWYRSELRGRMVQTLMEASIQSLHVMLKDTDMDDETAVLEPMVLFRPLDGDVRAEVEHHNTRYKKDLCERYQDNVTASGPDEIACAVKKVMGVEDSKWCEAMTAQTKTAKTNVESRVQEKTRFENTLQLDFKASMRLTTSNLPPNHASKGCSWVR